MNRLLKILATVALLVFPHAGEAQPGVFGYAALPARDFPAARRWLPVSAEIARCAEEGCLPETFLPALGSGAAHDGLARLQQVNSAVNRTLEYRPDGEGEDWAMPGETLQKGAGDCEDFAILKMAMLASLGFPLDRMSIVVVSIPQRDAFHAVLSVKIANKVHVLDSLTDRIFSDTQDPGYVPLYSLGLGNGWLHGRRSNPSPA